MSHGRDLSCTQRHTLEAACVLQLQVQDLCHHLPSSPLTDEALAHRCEVLVWLGQLAGALEPGHVHVVALHRVVESLTAQEERRAYGCRHAAGRVEKLHLVWIIRTRTKINFIVLEREYLSVTEHYNNKS